MPDRFEGNARGGYGDISRDDDLAFEEVPWRPGDPTTINEAPSSYAAGAFASDGIYRPSLDSTAGERGHETDQAGPAPSERGQRARWWTEESAPRKFRDGDKVKSAEAIGGPFMRHVDPGTRGEVVGRRSGLFGDEYLKVKFSNGYTEEVKPDAIQRDSWF